MRKYAINPMTGLMELMGASANNITRLSITGSNATAFVYSGIASGVNYTFSGKDANFSSRASVFNLAETQIYFNGVYMIKGVDVVWASQTTFTLNHHADNTDEIIIVS